MTVFFLLSSHSSAVAAAGMLLKHVGTVSLARASCQCIVSVTVPAGERSACVSHWSGREHLLFVLRDTDCLCNWISDIT